MRNLKLAAAFIIAHIFMKVALKRECKWPGFSVAVLSRGSRFS
jgi:hypothetical protein